MLERASDRLQIPEPGCSKILLEVASDLEDRIRYHPAEGCDDAEAARRPEEAFAAAA